MTRNSIIYSVIGLLLSSLTTNPSNAQDFEELLAETRDDIALQIMTSESQQLIVDHLVDAGLSEEDAKQSIEPMSNRIADCLFEHIDDRVSLAKGDDELAKADAVLLFLEDNAAVKEEMEMCIRAALVNAGLSVE